MAKKKPDWLVNLIELNKSMSLAVIAEEIGVSRRTIQRLMNDEGAAPSLSTWRAIQKLRGDAQ